MIGFNLRCKIARAERRIAYLKDPDQGRLTHSQVLAAEKEVELVIREFLNERNCFYWYDGRTKVSELHRREFSSVRVYKGKGQDYLFRYPYDMSFSDMLNCLELDLTFQ